jgi:hypothetical protein
MNFNKIVFFHGHVNGDCFQSRIIVNHIITKTKHLNIEYYYTAPRVICSHSLDLGILEENFNKYQNLNYNLACYIENNIFYINIWIGLFNHINKICVFCMKNIILNYNLLICDINKITNLNLEFINTEQNPFIKFHYSYYDIDHLNLFINEKKNIYKKIILIYNVNLTTFISLLKIDHNFYINILSNKYKDFLFITFNETNLNKDNIISINKIYNLSNKILPSSFGIQFSYLSELSDKVILLPTGPCLFCINDKNIKNKFMMIFDKKNNIYCCPYCDSNNDINNSILCENNLSWNVQLFYIDEINNELNINIYNGIDNFIL